jgi:hypothetical protein
MDSKKKRKGPTKKGGMKPEISKTLNDVQEQWPDLPELESVTNLKIQRDRTLTEVEYKNESTS